MTNSPLISVIVPIYNVEEYIHQCVDSIIIQTYKNLEIILVNDGSPDNCGKICDDYALKDSRIKVIHKKNGGLSDARNAGLDIAKGEYIVFTDSDDFIHPQFVEILHTNIGDADMAFCDLLPYYDNETEIVQIKITNCPTIVFEDDFLIKNIYYRSPIVVVAWNKLYKRFIWDSLRYPLGKIHEDEFVIHHILNKCNKIVLCDVQLYYYRQRSDSIMGVSNMSQSRIVNVFEFLEEREEFFLERDMYKEAKDTYNIKYAKYLIPHITNDNPVLNKISLKDILFDKRIRWKIKTALILKKTSSKLYLNLNRIRKLIIP